MMLTGKAIQRAVERGDIQISPFDTKLLNPNSYNVRLGDEMSFLPAYVMLDAKEPMEPKPLKLDEGGFFINPNRLYLAHTIETVGSDTYVPMLNGRSSLGRLGLQVHMTAGFGDLGFHGQWTLEIVTVNPIKLYPQMEIAQIAFFQVEDMGDVKWLYDGKYQDSVGAGASLLYKDWMNT